MVVAIISFMMYNKRKIQQKTREQNGK